LVFLLRAGRDELTGGRGAHAEEDQVPHGIASGQQAVGVVGRDLLGDVALQRGHLGEYPPLSCG